MLVDIIPAYTCRHHVVTVIRALATAAASGSYLVSSLTLTARSAWCLPGAPAMRAGKTLTVLCSNCHSSLVLASRRISEAGRAGDSQLQYKRSRSLAASKLSMSVEGPEGSGRDRARTPPQRRRTSEAINNDGLSDVSCLPFTPQATALQLLLATDRSGSIQDWGWPQCRARHDGPSKMSNWHRGAVCGVLERPELPVTLLLW